MLKKGPQARKDLGLIQSKKKKLQNSDLPEIKDLQEKTAQPVTKQDTLKRVSKARKQSRKWYELLEEEKKLTSILKKESRFRSVATDICE